MEMHFVKGKDSNLVLKGGWDREIERDRERQRETEEIHKQRTKSVDKTEIKKGLWERMLLKRHNQD